MVMLAVGREQLEPHVGGPSAARATEKQAEMMKVRDVLTRSVISVYPGTPLKDVARLLVRHSISGVPVVDARGSVLGVVSEADFLVKEQGAEAVRHHWLDGILGESRETRGQLAKIGATTAGAAMTSPAVTIDIDRPLPEAAAAMVSHRVNRLPVTDHGALVGIVSRADLVRAYVLSDEQLAATISQDVILGTMWLDPARFEVTVRDGVAQVRGTVYRRSSAEIIERIVAGVPGIIAVVPGVTWEVDDRDGATASAG